MREDTKALQREQGDKEKGQEECLREKKTHGKEMGEQDEGRERQ